LFGFFLPVPIADITPLRVAEFQRELQNHPDREAVGYVLQRLSSGFRVGFRAGSPLKSSLRNKLSASEHPQVISNYLLNEVQLGRVAGPYLAPPFQTWQVRLITDLSSPNGTSVNDGINPEEFHMQYLRVDEIIEAAAALKGEGPFGQI